MVLGEQASLPLADALCSFYLVITNVPCLCGGGHVTRYRMPGSISRHGNIFIPNTRGFRIHATIFPVHRKRRLYVCILFNS